MGDTTLRADDNYILELRGVTKRFPGVVANDKIDLAIRKGEIFALLGENGAGKSTLASMVFGMYEPDEGEMIVRGVPTHIASPQEAVDHDIGMVHQHFKLISNYTVTENIVLGDEPLRRLGGILPYIDLKGAEKKIEELSRNYGLEVDPRAVIEDIGVSTQQRVEILKMLYRNAELLIFDEPTAMLTPQEIEHLLNIIRELRESGKTIILITHKLEEVKQVADRCAVLREGRLVGVFDVATTSTAEMAAMMVGREITFDTEKPPARFGDVVLQVEDLTVEDANKFARVSDVSFKVRAGEIFAIAGVMGNGQVELANAIAGLAHIKAGTIRLNGADITRYSVRKRALAGVSYIPEDRHGVGLILDFPLQHNLAMKSYFDEPFSSHGVLKAAEFEDHAARLIDEYDIRAGRAGRSMTRDMSGGNQQKAIVAREVEENSDLMIFVQPTRGLDIGATMAIRERIVEQRQRGKAILLISLELDEVLALADTIGVMYGGRILKIAPACELTRSQVGEYMMGVKRS
ncbi:MAG: ABC transporter ATP-binding protein [Coriobacteriia bacterium]|nr:ABC transporter ATP-binding protein [Coriobacteriia bacterium]